MPDCDIIIFSLLRHDLPISSISLALAKEFARHQRVFYIDHPYSRKDYRRERHKPNVQARKEALLSGKNPYHNPPDLPPTLTIVTPRLTIPINFLPPGVIYKALSRINDRILGRTLQTLIRDFSIKRYVFINVFDPYFLARFPAYISPPPLKTIYYCVDDISQVEYSRKHGLRLEEEAIRNAAITLTTSTELLRLKSPLSPQVHLLPNAVDLPVFSTALTEKLDKPPEMQGIKRKIIGFTGSIEYRSDFALLRRIAEAHPDKLLLFIGPVDTNEHREVGLDRLENVLFIGPRPLNALPAYLQYMDCVLIPFRINALTRSIYPLKVNEYLAAGKPIVSTHFSEDIYAFREVVYVAESAEEFVGLIDRAIAEDSPERQQARAQVAAQNTWTARVEAFWTLISLS